MRHLDLFSGIGGAAIAVDAVWPKSEHIFCEIDPYCKGILKKLYPHAKIHKNIKTLKGRTIGGGIDIVSGGFPCQPFSTAGKRRGTEDDRHLWPQMLRVIKETSPRWIVGENVFGLVTWNNGLVLESVLSDLEREGYWNYINGKGERKIAPVIIPALSVGAPHTRDRVWIVAHTDSIGLEGIPKGRIETISRGIFGEAPKSDSAFSHEPRLFRFGDYRGIRESDGVPNRSHRLKGLGNAWVPQVAIKIFQAIKAIEDMMSL